MDAEGGKRPGYNVVFSFLGKLDQDRIVDLQEKVHAVGAEQVQEALVDFVSRKGLGFVGDSRPQSFIVVPSSKEIPTAAEKGCEVSGGLEMLTY